MRLAAILALGLLTCLPAACRRAEPSPRPLPTDMAAQPLDGRGGPPGQDGGPGVSEPLPTWTTPAQGAAPAASAPPGAFPGALPTSPLDALPSDLAQPTARARQAVAAGGPELDPEILGLLGQVDEGRLMADLRKLAGFGTRHALSSTEDASRGLGAARSWLLQSFDAAAAGGPAQLLVSRDPFDLRLGGQTSPQANIIATLSGIGFRKRMVYLVAHYDSRAEDVLDGKADAPGADDNATGVAALLELARVMRARQWDGTIRFVATAAEEQGMHGAEHHAKAAADGGLPILAVFNNDILGGAAGPDGKRQSDAFRVFSEGPDEGSSRALARYIGFVAERYRAATGLAPRIQAAADREGRGGDHQKFSAAGFAAARLISASEDEARQHNARDTVDRVDGDYLARMARLNLVLAANLALAPPAPEGAPRAEVLSPTSLRLTWQPVAEPEVAGYYLAWRPLDEPAWKAWVWVPGGATAEYKLDGLPTGVKLALALAASDDRGHASLFGPELRP